MALSKVNPNLITQGASGRKNLFINGGFDVWQRGTSLAGATSYLADRWFNGTTETQSRQAFTVGQTEVGGNPTYYHRDHKALHQALISYRLSLYKIYQNLVNLTTLLV